MAFSLSKFSSESRSAVVSDQSYEGKQGVMEEEERNSSSQKEQYLQFFKEVLPAIESFKLQNLEEQTLEYHKVKIIGYDDTFWSSLVNQGSIYVEPSRSKINGLQCIYDVVIGRFYLVVHVLNILRKAEDRKNINNREDASQSNLGKGTFGLVKLAEVQGKKIAIKRLIFNKQRKQIINIPNLIDANDLYYPDEIRKAIKQYCIYKICSMLGIGPQVMINNAFDLVCYNDGIEFQMQLCQVVEQNVRKTYAQDLTHCLAMLHSCKFVHKDIKPSNTLFSTSLNRYVLSDFGVSHSIKETLDEKTETYFRGSLGYPSSQMMALYDPKNPSKSGFVNLFFNDVHALKATISKTIPCLSSSSESYDSNQYSDSSYENQLSHLHGREQSYSHTNSEYNEEQQSDPTEESVQSSSSYETSIGFMPEQGPTNQVQVNYYIMKTIYCLFKEDCLTDSYDEIIRDKEQAKKLIKETAVRICSQKKDTLILDVVIRMTMSLLLPPDQKITNTITSTRILLRTYGPYSDQFIQHLQKLQKERNLSFINYQGLQSQIQELLRVRQKNKSKKFDSACSNLERNYRLSNNKKFLKDLNYISKMKSNLLGSLTSDQKKTIIRGYLTLIGENQIKSQQISEIKETIFHLLNKKFEEKQEGTKREPIVHVKKPSRVANYEQKVKLIQYFEKIVRSWQFYNGLIQFHFFEAYLKVQAKETAINNILPKVVSFASESRQKYIAQKHKETFLEPQITLFYLGSLTNHLVCLELNEEYEKALEVVNSNLSLVMEIKDSVMKMGAFYKFIQIFIIMGQLDKAYEYNQMYYVMQRQFFFPNIDSQKVVDYHQAKGTILSQQGKYPEAINSFKAALAVMSEPIRLSVNFIFVQQIYTKLMKCYEILNDQKNVLKYLQYIVFLSLENKTCSMQRKLIYLGTLIKKQIRMGYVSNLFEYFELFLNLKVSLLGYSDISEFCHPGLRGGLAFDLRQEEQNLNMSRQFMIKVKTTLLIALQPHLPLFLLHYRQLCQQVARFYIQLNMRSKAIPFIWNYFRKMPFYSLEQSQLFFDKVDRFASMLIEAHSNRAAFKFLQFYAYLIPNSLSKLKESTFKRLFTLSRYLGHKKFKFYNLVYKYRAFENIINYDFCSKAIDQIEDSQLKFPLKQAFKKKLAALQMDDSLHTQTNIFWTNNSLQIGLQEKQLVGLASRKRKQKRTVKIEQGS